MSAKEISGKKQGAKKGRRVSGNAPYGYMVDPDRKGMTIIDPEAAKVVRRIFDEALSGHTSGEISKMLNREGIDPPGVYFRKKHPENRKFPEIDDNHTWSIGTVRTILDRYAYTGASVYGRFSVAVPCTRKYKINKKDDLIIVKGVHEAIITEEEYDRVQALKHSPKPHIKQGIMYPLKSLVVCGGCGRAMRRSNTKRIHFFCNHKYDEDNSLCSNVVSPPEEKLEAIIYDEICRFIELAGMSIIKLKNKMNRDRSSIQMVEDDIRRLRQEAEKLKDEKLAAYERLVSGEISKDSYIKEKKNLNEVSAETEAKIRERELEVQILRSKEDDVCSEAQAACKEYVKEDHLTYEMAHAFIDKIIIYAKDRIEIKWRFRDFLAEKTNKIQEKGLA